MRTMGVLPMVPRMLSKIMTFRLSIEVSRESGASYAA
jgi:hypothetical protein